MDEPLVVRQLVDRQVRVGGPGREAVLVRAHLAVAVGDQPGLQGGGMLGAVGVDDDRALGRDALLVEQADDLGLVDAVQPRRRERDRARDVAAARLAVQSPAVVGGDRAQVDDGQAGVAEPVLSSSVVMVRVMWCVPFSRGDLRRQDLGKKEDRGHWVVTAVPSLGSEGLVRVRRSAQRGTPRTPAIQAGPPAHTHVAGGGVTDHAQTLPDSSGFAQRSMPKRNLDAR